MTTFGLVHGAWHGAWCWELLAPELEARGHEAVAVDLPVEDVEAGLTAYASLVADALDEPDDVVLVGHSLGGAVIPLVAHARPVRRLVFLCALVPQPGSSVAERYRSEDVFAPGFTGHTTTREDGCSTWADPGAAARCFYHDCGEAAASRAVERLRPQSPAPSHERWPPDALATTAERVSIVCRDDRAISPGWGRSMSRADLGVEPIELDGGHSPFLSRPHDLAEALCRDL